MSMLAEVWLGDCLDLMDTVKEKSVNMILTSPPYQVGKSYDESIDLEEFIKSASKLLADNGVFVWQVGTRVNNGFVEPLDILTHPVFLDLGFKLVNRVIWTFGHGLHCKNRFSGRYETVCIYSRTKDHTFNLDSVRIPSKYPNKKYYKGKRKGEISGNPLGKNPSDVWDISNVKHNHPEKTSHPCQFPLELASRCILAFTNEGDLILDPFAGSGTTLLAAKNLNRGYIGIEKEEKYYEIILERLGKKLV